VATAPKVINSMKDEVVSVIGAVGELFEGLITWCVCAQPCLGKLRGGEGPVRRAGAGAVLGSASRAESSQEEHPRRRAARSEAQRFCRRAVSS